VAQFNLPVRQPCWQRSRIAALEAGLNEAAGADAAPPQTKATQQTTGQPDVVDVDFRESRN
jgi:hypothetical protein